MSTLIWSGSSDIGSYRTTLSEGGRLSFLPPMMLECICRVQRDWGGVGMVDYQVRNVSIIRLRSGCDFNDSALPCGDPGVF